MAVENCTKSPVSIQQKPVTDDRLLKCAEVASILRISKTAAYRLAQSGELPCLRFGGGTVRVLESDLTRFIEASRVVMTDSQPVEKRTAIPCEAGELEGKAARGTSEIGMCLHCTRGGAIDENLTVTRS